MPSRSNSIAKASGVVTACLRAGDAVKSGDIDDARGAAIVDAARNQRGELDESAIDAIAKLGEQLTRLARSMQGQRHQEALAPVVTPSQFPRPPAKLEMLHNQVYAAMGRAAKADWREVHFVGARPNDERAFDFLVRVYKPADGPKPNDKFYVVNFFNGGPDVAVKPVRVIPDAQQT